MDADLKKQLNFSALLLAALEHAQMTQQELLRTADPAARKKIKKSLNKLLEELDAMQALAQRLEYVLDGAGLGSWDWWLKTDQVHFDHRWCEMLGLSVGDTPQHLQTWDSRIHPDDKAKAYRDIKAYLAGEVAVYENIHRMMHANGHWVWILDRGKISEVDASGNAIRFTGTHLDVTAYTEQQRLSEEIQRMAHIGGWELEASTGKTFWTPETYRIHAIDEGTPTDKIMGINFYAAHDRDRIARYVEECLQGKPYRDIFEVQAADSRKKWVEAMGTPVFDSAGKVYKVMGTFQDISEKVEANKNQQELAKSNAKYRRWIENANDAIWEIDQNGLTIFANSAARRLMKCDAAAMVGRSLFEFVSPDDRQHAALTLSLLMDGPANAVEWRMVDATGSEVWLNVSTVPSSDPKAKAKSVVAICSDITTIKARERELRKSSQAIMQLNARLGEAQEVAQMGSWSFDVATGGLEWSKELYKIFDIDSNTTPSILFDEYLSRIHPEDKEHVTQLVDRAVVGGISYRTEHRIIHRNGETRFVRTKVSVKETTIGRYITGVAQDITEQKLAENDARSHSDALERFFNVAHDLLCIADSDTTFIKINQAFSRVLGYSEADLLAKSIFDFVHPDDVATTSAETKKLSDGVPTVRFESRFRTKTGDYRILSWATTLDPVTGNLYASARDMTKQRVSESHNKEVFYALNQSAIIAYTDTKGKILDVNDNFCRISEYSREELIGSDHRIINSGKHSKIFFRNLWSTIKSGQVWTGDIENKSKNGKPYFVRTVISPLRSVNGEINKFMALRFDITGQKTAERRAEADRMKSIHSSKLASLGEMAAGIAHEINNPLAIIAGSAHNLPKFVNDPVKLFEKIVTIQKSSDRIAKIVRSLKKYSRSSENNVRNIQSLKKIVEEAITLTDAKAKMHGTTVEVSAVNEGRILCDEVEIEQVLVNLISNGIDAVKELDERWVRITMHEESGMVVLQVRDSGLGIDKELESKLFQPFFTTKAVGEGTGLGLSIAKGILGEHKGSVELIDAKHTCFEIRLPIVKDKENAA